MSLIVTNHGPLIVATNYWETPAARAGRIFVSINAGCFRVLLPTSVESAIADMATAREVLVSRGPWPSTGAADGFELLFDDRTADPFALHLAVAAFDRVPEDLDAGVPWTCSVWTGRRGTPRKVLERPCWYRRVPSIPWLKPREPG